ncbi:MAG: Na+/H+ antiporter [Candidatus Omnitrophica bacterium]|nr:Na+/H+ antiporter [Candidatus Omnitrophota bacterium]
MDPHLLPSLVIVLLISCFVAIIAEKLNWPYTIALVITGLIVAFTHLTPDLLISHDVIFHIILPPLLFHGGMHMDLEQLKKNWKSVSLLAVFGVIVSTFLIGYALHYIWSIDLLSALLFGALITPTDPISVLGILKRVGAPRRLRMILEGESIFNDGTGVVIFSLILSLLNGHSEFHIGLAFLEFLKVAGGGTLIGLIIGFLGYASFKRLDDRLHEVALTVVMAFGTPLLAEYFDFSGIIAVVVAGMIIGNYGIHYAMTERTRETLESFWVVIDFIINALLFFVIGLELQVFQETGIDFQWTAIIGGIVVLLISRAIVVYPMIALRNRLNEHDYIPAGWMHVLFWGGLKGSISIALVVGLPYDFQYRGLFLTAAFAIVLFTLVVQGLSMKPLLNVLNLSGKSEH